MANKVPDEFFFAVKATKEMTHARERDNKVFEQFRNARLRSSTNKLGSGPCPISKFVSGK